jgi:CheY-like chemotaxis protein
MEGTITVESEYGQGSRFTVRVPQKLIGNAPIGKEAADNLKSLQFIDGRRNQSKYLIRDYMPYGKVLVVDDVPTNLEVSKGLLKPYGLYVECVASGQEAIDLIRKATVRFDLILIDHLMPDMDGITATGIIRHEIDSDYARTVPIIALTANALAGSEAMFLAQGFNAFISKPIDVIRLDEILNRWIRDKQGPEAMKQGVQEKAALTESLLLEGAPSILQGSQIKGVDLAAGIARYEQEGIYLGILRSYLNHGKKILAQVRDVSRENLKEYGIAVHGLKGAS